MTSATPSPTHLIVEVDQTLVAIDHTAVVETMTAVRVASTPLAPPPVAGLCNRHGQVVVVADLSAALGLRDRGADPERPTVVVVETLQGQLGLLADRVDPAIGLDPDALEPAPVTMVPAARRLVAGLQRRGAELVAVLDTERLMNDVRTAGDHAPSLPELLLG